MAAWTPEGWRDLIVFGVVLGVIVLGVVLGIGGATGWTYHFQDDSSKCLAPFAPSADGCVYRGSAVIAITASPNQPEGFATTAEAWAQDVPGQIGIMRIVAEGVPARWHPVTGVRRGLNAHTVEIYAKPGTVVGPAACAPGTTPAADMFMACRATAPTVRWVVPRGARQHGDRNAAWAAAVGDTAAAGIGRPAGERHYVVLERAPSANVAARTLEDVYVKTGVAL